MPRTRLIIEMNDSELQTLQAIAHSRETEPSEVLRAIVRRELQQLAPTAKVDLTGLTLHERQVRRFALLERSSGIWQGERGKPRNGLHYQQELRGEWP